MYIESILVLMVVVAAVSDLRARRIPNALVASGIVIALALQTVAATLFPSFLTASTGWMSWMLGMLVGFGMFIPFYALRGMGAGDVKLMAAVGAFVGPAFAFKIALATFLIGGVWSLCVVVAKGKVADAWVNMRALLRPSLARGGTASGAGAAMASALPRPSVGRLPYGVAIALGTVAVLQMARG